MPDAAVCRLLLLACAIHGETEMASEMTQKLLEKNSRDDLVYAILAIVHAASKSWDKVADVRKMMKVGRVRKEIGQSWIEVLGKVHEFFSRDTGLERTKEVYDKLEELMEAMWKLGYKEVSDALLHNKDVADDRKTLCILLVVGIILITLVAVLVFSTEAKLYESIPKTLINRFGNNSLLTTLVHSLGKLLELGSHDELMRMNNGEGGAYSQMVFLQQSVRGQVGKSDPYAMSPACPFSPAYAMSPAFSIQTNHYDIPAEGNLKALTYPPPSQWRLLQMNAPEWKNAALGCLGAVGFGAVQPAHFFCLGTMISVFFIQDTARLKSDTRFY
ncbi:hypothetical protein IFM89_038616 [Coptis chinensis]|uniref:Pentatricopeptide repeat-containing protein n=1 Tax=Coptis chinensis TaxID=261450 RepID=A0A835LXS7_9MAGN|nr:hypothetical protein IFM89_038616 [Coptis chinensis]